MKRAAYSFAPSCRFGTCEIVGDGPLALQAYHAAIDEDKPFDLICLDLNLPGMDGGDVLKYLRHAAAFHTGRASPSL